jgi:capsular polysaccharide transport system ATP-binding protein
MIRLHQITKRYPLRRGMHTVLNKVSMEIRRGDKIGILGANGAGKSTLVRILSGASRPDSGRIERKMSISWPIAFNGGFQSSLTGRDNIRFLSRVYNVSFQKMIAFVDDFAELGLFLQEPVKNYSSGMRSRLAFAASMAINFDCFLIDEVIAVGDARFQSKCKQALFVERAEHGLVLVSHQEQLVRQHCQKAYVLHCGVLYDFPSLDEAFVYYKGVLQ